MRHILKMLFLTLLLCAPFELSHAKEVVLRWNILYDARIQSIEPGDVVIVPIIKRRFGFFGAWIAVGTRSYVIGSYLGEGSSAKVYSLANDPDHVLRLVRTTRPASADTRNNGDTQDSFDPIGMMYAMEEGYLDLVKRGVQVTRIYEYGRRYMVVDKAEGPTMADLVNHPKRFPDDERAKMAEALKTFARATYAFTKIGDFRADQLVYVQEKGQWLLRDWDHNHSIAERDSVQMQTIFDKYMGYAIWDPSVKKRSRVQPNAAGEPEWTWEAKLYMDLTQEVLNERARRSGLQARSQPQNIKEYVPGALYGTRIKDCTQVLTGT